MAIFLQKDIHQLLMNKFVVIIGSSVQRTIYKDLIVLLQDDKYMTDSQVRAKGEMSLAGDELLEGGTKGVMHNGISYREVRQYKSDYHLVRFYFITRCYNSYVESILADLSHEPKPDIIIFNSCLWDITRYGNCAVKSYKEKLEKLFSKLKETVTEKCLLIWNTMLPVSKNAKGGVLIPEVEYVNSTLRLEILEGNFFSGQLAVKYGIDVVDLHFFLRNHLHRRANDGIHWDMTAHRRMTNLFLTHIAEAWGIELPKHGQQADANLQGEGKKSQSKESSSTMGKKKKAVNCLQNQQVKGIVSENPSFKKKTKKKKKTLTLKTKYVAGKTPAWPRGRRGRWPTKQFCRSNRWQNENVMNENHCSDSSSFGWHSEGRKNQLAAYSNPIKNEYESFNDNYQGVVNTHEYSNQTPYTASNADFQNSNFDSYQQSAQFVGWGTPDSNNLTHNVDRFSGPSRKIRFSPYSNDLVQGNGNYGGQDYGEWHTDHSCTRPEVNNWHGNPEFSTNYTLGNWSDDYTQDRYGGPVRRNSNRGWDTAYDKENNLYGQYPIEPDYVFPHKSARTHRFNPY